MEQKIFFPQAKVLNMTQMIASLQTNQWVSLREIWRAVDLMTSCFPAVQGARFHQRPVQMFLLGKWDKPTSSWDMVVQMPSRVKRTLWWWRLLLHLIKGLEWCIQVSQRIMTDASSYGWGVHLNSAVAQGRWSPVEARESSNQRELLAVQRVLEAFQLEISGHHLQIRSNNISNVAYLNKPEGTRSWNLQLIAQKILSWAEVNRASIAAIHLKGTQNCLADYLSCVTTIGSSTRRYYFPWIQQIGYWE